MKDHMKPGKNSHSEGPAGYNGQNGPGEALKMPVKKYPQSQEGIPKTHSDKMLDGPCEGQYHK